MAPLHNFKTRSTSSQPRFQSRRLSDPEQLKEEVVDQQLKYIYQDRHGRSQDMSKLDKKRKGIGMMSILFSVFIISGIGMLAWYGVTYGWRFGGDRFGEEQVDMVVDIPKTISAGQPSTVTITITNRGTVTLTDLDLLLQFPKGFTFAESSLKSEGDEHRRWRLPDIQSQATSTLDVKGVYWAAVPSTQEVRASLLFRPENLRATFRVNKTASTDLTTSVVTMLVKAPDKLSLGQKSVWDIELSTTASDPVNGLSITLLPPAQFLLESTTPQAITNVGIEWRDLVVTPGTPTIVHLEGSFVDTGAASSEVTAREFKARLNYGNDFDRVTIFEQSIAAAVSQSAFFVRLKVNNSLSQISVNPPANLAITIDVVNRGVDPVSDVALALRLSSSQQIVDLVDLGSVKANPAPTVSGTTLVWDKKSAERLSFIRGGDTVTLTLEVPARPQAIGSLDFSTVASYPFEGASKSVESNTTSVQFAPLIDGHVQAHYYNEDNLAFGTGPIPPRVGVKTTLAIALTFSKRSGAYQNIRWVLPLEKGVEYVSGTAGAGTITIDSKTRSVIWSIPTLPDTLSSLTADVRVAVTPTPSDVGTIIPLTGTSQITAVTMSSSATVTRTVATRTTTNLDGDPQVAGRGTVVAQ